jgi:glycosyltransferase involved in cell wall biosynthesis
MRRILYIESSETNGGGSLESLTLLITSLTRYEGIPVYVNSLEAEVTLCARGYDTRRIYDAVYSRHDTSIQRWLLRLLTYTAKYAPRMHRHIYYMCHRSAIRSITDLCRQEQVDAIHLNNRIGRDLFGVYAAQRAGIPCISHLRGGVTGDTPQATLEFANQYVCRYIAVSEHIKDIWVQRGIEEAKATVIHNGISELAVEPLDVREQYNLPSDSVIVCSLGRLVTWKNQEWIIRSFAHMPQTDRPTYLLLVGGGPERNRLEQLCTELGVADQVIFTGHTPQALSYLRASDVFILGSYGEPCARSILEAMYLQKPIVAARSGGNPELLTHNESGLLVDVDDVSEMQQALHHLITSPELRERLSQNALERVQTHFTVETNTQQVERVYDQCIAE